MHLRGWDGDEGGQILSAQGRIVSADAVENAVPLSEGWTLPPDSAAPGPLSRREWLVFVALMVLAAVLLLANLGNQYLWEDEAQTALVAKTVLTYGIPMGYDGRNNFSGAGGLEYSPRNHVWRWHTWFTLYLLAGFFAVLGDSTFVARLPFALLGLGTVALVYFWGRALWSSRRAAALAAILLALCVPFLLLSRQCRYYSPAMFFSLAALAAYWYLMRRRRWAGPLFLVATTLLFHTHYLYFGTLLATTTIHVLFYHRDRWKAVALWSLAAVLVNLPWMIWLFAPPAAGHYPDMPFEVGRVFTEMWKYSRQLVHYVFSPVFMAVLALVAVVLWSRLKRWPVIDPAVRREANLLLLFTGLTIVAASVGSPYYFFRYAAPLIPLLILLGARIIEALMRIRPVLGLVAIVALVAFSPMRKYLYEITHDYDGPTEGIVKYLQDHARPGDTVLMTSGDLTVKYYTGLHVVGGLTGEDLSAVKDPEWIIVRNHTFGKTDEPVKALAQEILDRGGYDTTVLVDYPDIPHENRESPTDHLYWTDTKAPPVVIHHRLAD
jgi:hypothetical protein